MGKSVAYRNPVSAAFAMPDAPTLVSQALQKSNIAVTELRCDQRNFGRTVAIPREDAYLIALQLRECRDHDLYFDGRRVQPQNFAAGVTTIYDLRCDPIADLRDPFHSVMFHLPLKVLALEGRRGGRGCDLRHDAGVGVDDPVVRHLLSSLLPAISRPAEAHSLFLDHVTLALVAHVANRYGGVEANLRLVRGGLAPWQERRAKELMSATLQEELPLNRLAAECNLSVRHFVRAFRRNTGTSPHQWLLKRRVEHARALLQNRGLSLTEVALACGFADQSHFTRVFTNVVGVSPGAWRRGL